MERLDAQTPGAQVESAVNSRVDRLPFTEHQLDAIEQAVHESHKSINFSSCDIQSEVDQIATESQKRHKWLVDNMNA